MFCRLSMSLCRRFVSPPVRAHSGLATCGEKTDPRAWILPTGTDLGIRVFNSQTRTLVPLVVADGREVTLYSCGPTVYASAHVGHASCFVHFDIVRRILEGHFCVAVRHVMNITDIDDKIMARARRDGEAPAALARRFEAEFCAQMAQLRVLPPRALVRVSEHIPEIVAMIQVRGGIWVFSLFFLPAFIFFGSNWRRDT
jgi:hypothetical protein